MAAFVSRRPKSESPELWRMRSRQPTGHRPLSQEEKHLHPRIVDFSNAMGVEAGISSENLPRAAPHPRDAGVQDRAAERPTSEPSGGVSGAMGVPTDEAHPAEAPVGDTMDTDVGHAGGSNDVEMDFVGNISHSQGIGSLEPSFDDDVSGMLLAEMGSSGRVRRKDGRKAVRRLVSEIYSPPRVTELLKRTRSRHLMAGFALDLTVMGEDGQPWDFTQRDKRETARRLVREQKPYMLIGSPACKGFSTWQALNLSKSKDQRPCGRRRSPP